MRPNNELVWYLVNNFCYWPPRKTNAPELATVSNEDGDGIIGNNCDTQSGKIIKELDVIGF